MRPSRPTPSRSPRTATLLDALDAVKDKRDGTLAYRKSCRMAVCGSCGMRLDGGAVLACKTAMRPYVDAGHVPTISPMGNLPVIKDLVVDMEPFWAKIRAVKPYLQSDLQPPEKEFRVDPEVQEEGIGKEALCIMCGCCVSECNSMEADPDFLGPAALAKAQRFVGDVRDTARARPAQGPERGARHLGLHPLLLLQPALPQGRRPARRHRQARRRVVPPRADPRRGREARQGLRLARPTAAGTSRRPSWCPRTIGPVAALMDVPFALRLARAGKVPNPLKPTRRPATTRSSACGSCSRPSPRRGPTTARCRSASRRTGPLEA